MNKRFLSIVTAGALAAALSLAQPATPPPGAEQPEGDPPGRAARVSFLQGNISLNPAGVEEWVPANLNRPLTTGDKLWVEGDARAEVHLGTVAIRIGGNTSFGFVNLDDQTAQMQVSSGSVCIRVRRLGEGEVVEVDTPQLALSLLRPGEYRIDVSEQDGSTTVTVRGGEAEITASGQAIPVQPRQQVRVAGGDQPTFDKRDAPPMDALDNFCMERDRREDRALSSVRYVSRDIPGYADLEEFGDWRPHPTYGAVWFPRAVAVDWAPYRHGNFAWIGGWGYTWVGEEPWGYAPYHYGRWSHLNGRWGWIPGPLAERPVYSPALVSWVGGDGFGAELAVGGGAVGWFPLGPGEVYVPSWRASSGYFTRVNRCGTVFAPSVRLGYIHDTVIVRNGAYRPVYANHFVGGAVSACRVTDFGAGRAVRECGIRVTPGALRRGEFVRTAYVVPTRGAVFGGGRLGGGHAPPRVIVERTVIVRREPPRVVPFDRQQGSFRNNPGRPVDPGTLRGLRNGLPPERGGGYRPVGSLRGPQGGPGQGGGRPPQGTGQGGIRPPQGGGRPAGGGRPPQGTGQGGIRPPQGGGQPTGGGRPPQGTGQGGIRPPQGGGQPTGGGRPPQGTGQGGIRPPQGGGQPTGGGRPPQGTGQGGIRPPQGGGQPAGGGQPPKKGAGQGGGQPTGGVQPQGTGQGGVRPPQGGSQPAGGTQPLKKAIGQGGMRPPQGGMPGGRPAPTGGTPTGNAGVKKAPQTPGGRPVTQPQPQVRQPQPVPQQQPQVRQSMPQRQPQVHQPQRQTPQGGQPPRGPQGGQPEQHQKKGNTNKEKKQ